MSRKSEKRVRVSFLRKNALTSSISFVWFSELLVHVTCSCSALSVQSHFLGRDSPALALNAPHVRWNSFQRWAWEALPRSPVDSLAGISQDCIPSCEMFWKRLGFLCESRDSKQRDTQGTPAASHSTPRSEDSLSF